MSWFYKNLVRPTLFTRDSEEIHNTTLDALAYLSHSALGRDLVASFYDAPAMPVQLGGLRFSNPVGLAAGMDKRAAALPIWEKFGFGFCELGGVTRHPQPGNDQPRMFRAVADEALVNRMGFNNPGAEAMAASLAEWRRLGCWPGHPVGINLGKSKITPLEQAAEDYAFSFETLWSHADFFVVNVSSPNTPNLRQLQDKEALDTILGSLQEINSRLATAAVASNQWNASQSPHGHGESGHRPKASARSLLKPIWIKVAPDLTFTALDEILELAQNRQLAGLVATNTTIERPTANDPGLRKVYAETGGLSGRPLGARSTEVIRHLYRQSDGGVPIIGVGGVFTAADAWEKITAGASLVQVYTGMVFEGPGIAGSIVDGLRDLLAEHGLKDIREAVGLAAAQPGLRAAA